MAAVYNWSIVDAALGQLGTGIGAIERFSILKTLVRFWHGEIQEADGISDQALGDAELPVPLRWWYRFAGNRKNILSGQNRLLNPEDLKKTPEGFLVFYGENQWCYEWATLPEGDDPPVYGREGFPEAWTPEGITLSEHLILACLFEGVMCHCQYGASAAWLDSSTAAQLVAVIPPLSINPWHWGEEMRFHAKDGAFMCTMCNRGVDGMAHSVFIGAKTEQPLQFLKPFIDDSWEYVAV